jgi:hypothetical protein
MKRMTIGFLAAIGFAGAAFANSSDVSRMEDPSHEQIASGEALPEGESAYGYSVSDPYTDGTIIVQEEYILLPSDTLVLIPMEDDESASHIPG